MSQENKPSIEKSQTSQNSQKTGRTLDRGLSPAKNPPPMPRVQPPRTEKEG